MLLNVNKAINSLQKHIQSMMKVSAKYGKKMGNLGNVPFQSAHGGKLSFDLASHMGKNPERANEMLKAIMERAENADMLPAHMERMNVIADRIRDSIPTKPVSGPTKLKWM